MAPVGQLISASRNLSRAVSGAVARTVTVRLASSSEKALGASATHSPEPMQSCLSISTCGSFSNYCCG